MSKAQWIKENLKAGEQYVGILLGLAGEPDQHIILLPGQVVGQSWENCKAWAVEQGGELPTRREQRILFANAKSSFDEAWYWSGEQGAAYPSDAWYQGFDYGGQGINHKSYEGRARAVRRLPI